MITSSSSTASGLPAKRSNPNPKTPVRRSPFTDFGSYMAEKNRKLRSQFEASAGDGKGIFHGVSIFVDGHTVPSSQELRGYMLRHGGRFENYFSRSRVSHIICSNLPDSKMRNIRAFSRGLPVLKPAWIVDSVAANKLLSWSPYQLVEHSSEIYKQQKLSAFFRCKTISSLKDAEVTSGSNEGMDSEGLQDSKGSPFQLERTKEEASSSNSAQLPTWTSSCIDYGNSGEHTNSKCRQVSVVNHSTLSDPNFVENYFKDQEKR